MFSLAVVLLGTILLENVGAQMAGPADLVIKSIEKCPDPDQYLYTFEITRHKINRTHEAFDGSGALKYPMDDKTRVYINVAKKAKDGYKPNEYEFKDDNACEFLMNWVGDTFKEILKAIDQPQSCPLKEGSYSVTNYLIDYRQLTQILPYGDFRADIYLLRGEEKLACVQAFVVTKPKING